MKQYKNILRTILENGVRKGDRTGTGTISIFGHQERFDLSEGFPLLTTKKLHTRSIFYELLWFIAGRTDVQWLQERKVRIWNEWATVEQCARFNRVEGDLGPIYGHQWRNFGASWRPSGGYANDGMDQLHNVVEAIKTNPDGRRHIVTGWNPLEANQVALPPCHTMFQFYVNDGKLSCQLYQRSADAFLGVPFNIASYALLIHMVAQVCGLEVGDFVHTFGDLHLYNDHVELAEVQLERECRALPRLVLNPEVRDIFDFAYEDIKIQGYSPHPRIKAKVSI